MKGNMTVSEGNDLEIVSTPNILYGKSGISLYSDSEVTGWITIRGETVAVVIWRESLSGFADEVLISIL